MILLNGKIMHVIEWVTKTVNRDGKNLRHLKSQKINLFQSFLYLWAFNLVFICPTLCQLKTTCVGVISHKCSKLTKIHFVLMTPTYVPLTYEKKIIHPGRFFH